ncbi:MAG: DUF58 domain-containing protein [Candidatus Eremiobacteraeota bacterium]|nr:DUF58 domain-containing protein [Candidatus Eremiobacteraeota bacterium]
MNRRNAESTGWRSALRYGLGRGTEFTLAAMAVVLFLVATNTQTGWLYLVCAVLLGLLGLGFVGSRRQIRGLEVHCRLLGTQQVGQPARLEVSVENRGTRTRYHLLVSRQAQPWEMLPGPQHQLIETLAPGQTLSVTLAARPAVRGQHQFGGLSLSSSAPLGYFPAVRALVDSQPFTVYPQTFDLPSRATLAEGARFAAHETSARQAGSSQDLRRLRDYQPGEDRRFVHWPSSARTGELMVREFARPLSPGLVLMLANLEGSQVGPYPDTAFEAAIKLAASLVVRQQRQGQPVVLLTLDGATWRRHEGPAAALERLARLEDNGPQGWDKLPGPALKDSESSLLLTVFPPTPAAARQLQVARLVMFRADQQEAPLRAQDYHRAEQMLGWLRPRLWQPDQPIEAVTP